MRVFLSWSGEASQRIAELLRKFLPCMIQELRPFMSRHDLSSGGRWSHELSKELEGANFGIICLTPENLQSPWILFEAGALTKHVEGKACCLLFRGLRAQDVSGPLSQFQNASFSRPEFRKLVFDMNRLLAAPIDQANLDTIFDKWWPDLESAVQVALANAQAGNSAGPRRDSSDLLGELLLRVRGIQRMLELSSVPQPKVEYSDSSVSNFLESLRRNLTPTQIDLLREFVTPAKTRSTVSTASLLAKYPAADVEQLKRMGLIAENKDGFTLPHDLVAKVVADTGTGVSNAPCRILAT